MFQSFLGYDSLQKRCELSLISDSLLPFWSHIGCVLLPHSFPFNKSVLIYNTLKKPFPVVVLVICTTEYISHMPRGIVQISIQLFKVTIFRLRKVMVRVLCLWTVSVIFPKQDGDYSFLAGVSRIS